MLQVVGLGSCDPIILWSDTEEFSFQLSSEPFQYCKCGQGSNYGYVIMVYLQALLHLASTHRLNMITTAARRFKILQGMLGLPSWSRIIPRSIMFRARLWEEGFGQPEYSSVIHATRIPAVSWSDWSQKSIWLNNSCCCWSRWSWARLSLISANAHSALSTLQVW